MSALAIAVLFGFAGDPACGNAPPPLARRLVAIALAESAGRPDAVGQNAHAPPDYGLMQISTAALARHGLNPTTALDPCRSMRAGADHYADDMRAAVEHLASQRYNTGGFTAGEAYARRVDAIAATLPPAPASPHAVAEPAHVFLQPSSAQILRYGRREAP